MWPKKAKGGWFVKGGTVEFVSQGLINKLLFFPREIFFLFHATMEKKRDLFSVPPDIFNKPFFVIVKVNFNHEQNFFFKTKNYLCDSIQSIYRFGREMNILVYFGYLVQHSSDNVIPLYSTTNTAKSEAG